MANNKRPIDIPDKMIDHGLENDPQIKYNSDKLVWVQSTVTPRKCEKKTWLRFFMVKKGYNNLS